MMMERRQRLKKVEAFKAFERPLAAESAAAGRPPVASKLTAPAFLMGVAGSCGLTFPVLQ